MFFSSRYCLTYWKYTSGAKNINPRLHKFTYIELIYYVVYINVYCYVECVYVLVFKYAIKCVCIYALMYPLISSN